MVEKLKEGVLITYQIF